MRLAVIFNSSAAAGRSARLRGPVAAHMRRLGIEPHFLPTHAPGHAIELAASTDLNGVDGLVAAGGDGTVFEVVNGLYRRPAGERVPLGVLPVGTGNAFARDLGLGPGDWRSALDLIARGRVTRIDVGRVEARDDPFHFVNIVGMGFAVDAGLAARRLKALGNAAYTLATLWRVLRLKSYPLEIEIDGERVTEDNVFVEVSNTRYTGTRFLIAPRARMDDGLLDVTLLRGLGRMRLLRLFPTIYDGRHLAFEEVRTWQARHIRILAPEGMPLAPDGEFRGVTPVEIRCLPQDLALFR